MLVRNPEIAPFAMFLVFFWPVSDMLFAVARRIRNGMPLDQPDRMHFHQFVMRAIELTLLNHRAVSNPLAASFVWIFAALPISLAVTFKNSNILAAFAWLFCFTLFIWTYVVGIRVARFLSRARKNNESLANTIKREGFVKLRGVAIGKSSIYPAE